MHHFIRTTAIAALLLASLPAAQAAVQNYSFNGTLDSGFYIGQSFSGSFSFDDAGLTGSGAEWLNSVSSLNMSFLGTGYSLSNATAPVEVDFYNGSFTGLAYNVGTSTDGFTLIAGTYSPSEASLAYDTTAGFSGAGSVIYAPVPEPESYALLLAGLGLLGVAARRRT